MSVTIGRGLVIGALLALAACGSAEPTRFYLLSADAPAAAPARQGPIVFVDQATVAPYLDRAQIVTRVTPDQVAFADVRTWGEPLPSMITRYVVDALGAGFGPDRVLETPGRRDFDPDFRIAIDVQRFDGDQAGAMVLDARWTLLAGTDERFVATGRERIVAQADDPASWDARVAALGRALATFSGKVGEAVSANSATRRPITATSKTATAR